MRLLMLAALAMIVIVFFYTSRIESQTGREGRTLQDFYDRTVSAMDRKKPHPPPSNSGDGSKPLPVADRDRDGDIDADDEIMGVEMQERLKAAEIRAKERANEKAGFKPDPPSKMVGVGSSADGQKKGSGADAVGSDLDDVQVKENAVTEVSDAQKEAEAELNLILKRSPSMFPPSIITFTTRCFPDFQSSQEILHLLT